MLSSVWYTNRPMAAVGKTHAGVSTLMTPGAMANISMYEAVVRLSPMVVTRLGAIQAGRRTRQLSARGLRMYLYSNDKSEPWY